MRNTTTIAALASLGTAGPALAFPFVGYWVPVDNSINPVTMEATGLETDYLTFDLYIELEPGYVIGAIDSGYGAGNTGLITDGAFFQSPLGSDSAKQNINNAADHAQLPFDTAAAMNNEDLAFAAAMDWDPDGVSGAWFSAMQMQVPGPLWVARITVGIDTTFLGGEMFIDGVGPNGNFGYGGDLENLHLYIVDIPNAIPNPGASAVIALIGVASIRRRR